MLKWLREKLSIGLSKENKTGKAILDRQKKYEDAGIKGHGGNPLTIKSYKDKNK